MIQPQLKEGDEMAMEMNLISNGTTTYGASGIYEVAAGKKVKVHVEGIKEFEEVVPTGKKWDVTISVKIKEENI